MSGQNYNYENEENKSKNGYLVLNIRENRSFYIIPPNADNKEDVIEIKLTLTKPGKAKIAIKASRKYQIFREESIKKICGLESL